MCISIVLPAFFATDYLTSEISQRALELGDSRCIAPSPTLVMALPPPSRFAFPQDPSAYAPAPAPSVPEWQQLWAAWDLVTRQMIPEPALLSKPIHLRNCCLFYLGHIPGFLDLKLTGGTDEPLTEPAHFATLFERGIDPDVEDPSRCHAHSAIPAEWPPVAAILQYQQNVRRRVLALYARGRVAADRRVARTMWLGMEHEGRWFSDVDVAGAF